MLHLPPALAAMGNYRQFMAFKLVANPSGKKDDKLPVDPRTGQVVSAHDSHLWVDFATASAFAQAMGSRYGVAFVFTVNDPFWFLDIDDCLQADNTWSPLAQQLMGYFPGAAVEVSSSGKGLHIFGCGTCPPHGCKNTPLGLEFYTSGRFVALTGTNAVGDTWLDWSAQLASVTPHFFPVTGSDTPAEWTDGPAAGWSGPENDDDLLALAMKSTSGGAAFGTKASFKDLWEANTEVLAVAYPDAGNKMRAYGESEADAALIQHLCFWTGNDCERIQRLMRQSALVRDKWEREDYLPRTILRACSRQTKFATGHVQIVPPSMLLPSTSALAPAELGTEVVAGSKFMTLEQQQQHFKGCVYVCDFHGVLVPGGHILKPDQFRVMYGGYLFPMDAANEKITRNPWEAFTESHAIKFPRAETVCFYPNKAPGEVVSLGGVNAVNIWHPIEPFRVKGDPSPFLRHLEKLLPNEYDRQILLSYMAACVQHQGVKFQWCPFIQGVEGNGKTLFTRCVAFAIGMRYCHFPKAKEIANQFNDWMWGKTFIGIEDIFVTEAKMDVMEAFKPMVTSDYLEIEGKGIKKVTRNVCCNFMVNSNHKDGIRKHANDRRCAMFYTAQQNVADLARDGLTGSYFYDVYNWLKGEGPYAHLGANHGYAVASDYLHSFQIPDRFNPATQCQRAPATSSLNEALEAGLGSVEQEVQEAVLQGMSGFCGGWVSSIALDRLLERMGATRRISPRKRKELLLGMGYVVHPALADGRVNNIIMPDAGKPRLYLTANHPALAFTQAADVAKAYSDSQQG